MVAALILLLFTGYHPQVAAGSAQMGPGASDSLTTNKSVRIDKIFIIGNRETRERIIRRELHLKEGEVVDSLQLHRLIEEDKNKILNTKLFLSVDFNVLKVNEEEIDIIIRVVERWYLFPIPIFELADRNFNEWWVNQERDFSRVNYGLKLYRFNMRGRNETLKLLAQFGYTKKFQLSYSFPYIDRAQKLGLKLVSEYSENKNFNYLTIANKQQDLDFLESDKWMLRQLRLGFEFSYRRSFYNTHDLGFTYFNHRIRDTIAVLNPNFLLDGDTRQRYFEAHYTFTRDLRDAASYPLEGFLMRLQAVKSGLGIFNDHNQFRLSASYAHFLKFGENLFLSVELGGISSWPERQPYLNVNALGYEPYDLRGYELYVIEGQHLLYNRYTLKNRIFEDVFINPMIPIRQFQTFPIAIYLKTFFDLGYVNSSWNIPENNRFVNKPLYGGGVGLDIVTFYDLVMRMEYSINGDREGSFVFGLKRDF